MRFISFNSNNLCLIWLLMSCDKKALKPISIWLEIHTPKLRNDKLLFAKLVNERSEEFIFLILSKINQSTIWKTLKESISYDFIFFVLNHNHITFWRETYNMFTWILYHKHLYTYSFKVIAHMLFTLYFLWLMVIDL